MGTWSNIFYSSHQGSFGWMRTIINLTETNSSYCKPFIRLFFSRCLHFSPLSSIKKSKLPFRPQKYDIWRSNDLQTISGNVHRESWKCIFPFPLWGLHAHRRFNTIVAVSFLGFFPLSVSWIILLLHWLSPSPTSFSSPAHLQFSMFMYLTFANESLAGCRTREDRKCSDESSWLLLIF